MSTEITMYSTTWCPDCRRAMKVFKDAGVSYRYIDIEQDEEAAEEVERLNNGNRSVPTIVFPDGSRLVEPSNAELLRKIQNMQTPSA